MYLYEASDHAKVFFDILQSIEVLFDDNEKLYAK